jgi:Fe2+ transport system protein B
MPLLGIENEIFAIICAISLIFLVFTYLFGWGKDFRKAKGDIFVFALNNLLKDWGWPKPKS